MGMYRTNDKGLYKGWFFNGQSECDIYRDTDFPGFQTHAICKKTCTGKSSEEIVE